MKIGDLVQFTYGRVGGQIEGIGIFAERGYYGIHKVISENKTYWVPEGCIKLISMKRKDSVNEVKYN
jgi:hypothetical protein